MYLLELVSAFYLSKYTMVELLNHTSFYNVRQITYRTALNSLVASQKPKVLQDIPEYSFLLWSLSLERSKHLSHQNFRAYYVRIYFLLISAGFPIPPYFYHQINHNILFPFSLPLYLTP